MHNNDNKSSIPFYDAFAPTYDTTCAQIGYKAIENVPEWTAGYFEKPGRLLDIGIGTRLASQPFAAKGWSVVGIDGSRPMLELVHAKGFCRELFEADLSNGEIPLYGDPFDLHICSGVLEFIRDLPRFCREVKRLSNTDSRTVVLVVLRDIELNPQLSRMELDGVSVDAVSYEKNGYILVHHKLGDLEATFRECGFEVEEKDRTIAYDSPTQGSVVNSRVIILSNGK